MGRNLHFNWPRVVVLSLVAGTLIGCAGGGGANRMSAPEMSARPQGALTPAEVVGVWALTDRRNSTFNIRLAADGSAVSTWSAGPSGSIGERGRWTLVDGRVVIEWNTGWQDTIAIGLMGIEQWSWSPGADRAGLPTTFGMAVPIRDEMAEFVGVWQMRGVLPGDPSVIYVAIQSDGMIFKSVGDYRYGCWTSVPTPGRSGGRIARLTWANGWYDEIDRDQDGYVVRTWLPEETRGQAPAATSRVRRLD